MTLFSGASFSDIFVRQSQNTARLAFEVQFQSVKRRLDTELNVKKEQYNNIDKSIEPMVAGYKRQRAAFAEQQKMYSEYLSKMSSNITRINDVINNLLPKLSLAASDVGPGADTNFNSIRDQMNKALRAFQPASVLQDGVVDQTQSLKVGKNPSKIGDYSSYATLPDRANAVGILITGGDDGLQVMPGLSYGLAEDLGHLRNKLTRDFDVIKNKLGKTETKTDSNGKVVLDQKGNPVTIGTSGVYKRLTDLDRQIEKVDAEQRVIVLRDVQAMEKKNEQTLRSLSLNFEFSQASSEIMADKASFLKPQKGSIMNLFI